MGFADMCATYFKAPALYVRLPCATAMPPCVWMCRAMCTGILRTHCMVHGIRGYVCHLLQGTCSVCTFAVCYGDAALCLDVSCYVYRYTENTLHGTWDSRICVPLTSRHLLCMYVCRVLRRCRLVSGCVVLCVPVY